MAERAARLVDHVFPDVPVRQWVLSVPCRLRYLLAWDHDLCRALVAVHVRAVLGFLRRRARRDGVTDGRSEWPAPNHAPLANCDLHWDEASTAVDGAF